MPMLMLPPVAMPEHMNVEETGVQSEDERSSSDEDNEQPTSPYQSFTTAMTGILAPALTPPMGTEAINANAPIEEKSNDDDNTDKQFEDGEYIMSDSTAEEANNMSYSDGSDSDGSDENEETLPNIHDERAASINKVQKHTYGEKSHVFWNIQHQYVKFHVVGGVAVHTRCLGSEGRDKDNKD